MQKEIIDPLQIREIFHLEFLRWFGRKVKAEYYALKGGVNLRFFFNSIRYSEDMYMDVHSIEVAKLKDIVMEILQTLSFQDSFRSVGIVKVIPPDIVKAKQTETTQRFKIHLVTTNGEDLFTKIEFSRRGIKGSVVVQTVLDNILRAYKMPPLLVPHYDIQSAVMQKINALAGRTIIQGRDIFDIYTLSSQYSDIDIKNRLISREKLLNAHENIFKVSFEEFRDTVIFYLSVEDQNIYGNVSGWEEVRLKTADFIDELCKKA